MKIALIIIIAALTGIGIPVVVSNAKLKAKNTKLKIENENLEYELGKRMLDKKNYGNERINLIKEKYKQTEIIKPEKKVTKEEVEAFYENQRQGNKKNNILKR